uniref:Uncharacterized protein n=1 Tax=Arundo donax TaxID=35708 RepID=A0A0A9A2R6_ARUDO
MKRVKNRIHTNRHKHEHQ